MTTMVVIAAEVMTMRITTLLPTRAGVVTMTVAMVAVPKIVSSFASGLSLCKGENLMTWLVDSYGGGRASKNDSDDCELTVLMGHDYLYLTQQFIGTDNDS